MIVTELKQKGKSESYYVAIDGEPYGLLQLEVLVKNHIKVGLEVDEDLLRQIKQESDQLTCFSCALKYISSRLKTEKQMREYLLGKQYSIISVDNAITKLKDYGYINDQNYAKTFVDVYGESKGKKYLQNELMQKGVKKDIILEIIQNKDDTLPCKTLCAKKLKNMTLPLSQKDKEKVYRFLLSRGFDYQIIKNCLSEYTQGECDDWD